MNREVGCIDIDSFDMLLRNNRLQSIKINSRQIANIMRTDGYCMHNITVSILAWCCVVYSCLVCCDWMLDIARER